MLAAIGHGHDFGLWTLGFDSDSNIGRLTMYSNGTLDLITTGYFKMIEFFLSLCSSPVYCLLTGEDNATCKNRL
jgi:hypothetical protein